MAFPDGWVAFVAAADGRVIPLKSFTCATCSCLEECIKHYESHGDFDCELDRSAYA